MTSLNNACARPGPLKILNRQGDRGHPNGGAGDPIGRPADEGTPSAFRSRPATI